MNLNTSAFFCHGCKEKGSAVDFAAYVLQISPLQAIKLLKSAYQPGAINPDARNMVSEVQKILAAREVVISQPVLDESIASKFSMDWYSAYKAYSSGDGFPATDYFFERGFLPISLTAWGFGFDQRSGRVVFPIHNENGQLIGFKGRAHWANAKPKYLVLGDGPGGGPYGFPRYYPSHVVFGAHRAAQEVEATKKPLVICEGELNAVACRDKTSYAAVAINGSFFSEWHARIIRKIASDHGVILFLDEDDAGRNCTWGWFNSKGERKPGIVDLLSPHMPVKIAGSHDQDAAQMSASENEECLAASSTHLLARIGRS
jgi:hypothetical protein